MTCRDAMAPTAGKGVVASKDLWSPARKLGFAALALVSGSLVSLSYFGKRLLPIDDTYDPATVPELWHLAVAALVFAAAIAGFLLFAVRVDRGRTRRVHEEPSTWARRVDAVFRVSPRNVLLIALVIFVVWTPTVIICGPFDAGADTMAQLLWSQGYPAFDPSSAQLLPGYVASDHHPYLLTCVYGAFYDLGEALGDPVLGMVVLEFATAAVFALVMAYACCWIRDRGLPRWLSVFAFLFWTINPLCAHISQFIIKDVSSMPFFMLWLLWFVDSTDRSRCEERSVLSWTAFAVVTLLCALMRKTLLYVCVPPMLLVSLREFRSKRLRVLAASAASWFVPAFVYLVLIQRMLLPALGVASGGLQETIGVPIQQVSAVVVNHADELSEDELATIAHVLPVDKIAEKFTTSSADPVKDLWIRDSTDADRTEFLKLWVELAFRYPKEYLGAVRYLGRFWTYGIMSTGYMYVWDGWAEMGADALFPEYPAAYQTEGQLAYYSFLKEGVYQTLPGKFLLDLASYQVFIPLASLCVVVWRKNGRGLLAAVPIMLSMAVAFTVSAYHYRYAWNQVYCAPVILAIAFLPKLRVPGHPGIIGQENEVEGL